MPQPFIKLGSRGDTVRVAQTLLQCSGFYTARADGEFGPVTEASVIHFQQTHNGPTGVPLKTDGVVGPDTWWALNNPQSPEDKEQSFAKTKDRLPGGLPNDRKVLLITALMEVGNYEIPDGSNWGPKIRKYLEFIGLTSNPWCLAFVMWVFNAAFSRLPWGGYRCGLVADFWNFAKRKSIAKDLNYTPSPGDIFIMVHQNGTGHTGVVLRVSHDGKWLNIIEGNSGNAVRIINRKVGANDHVGYVVALPEFSSFERGLIDADSGTTTR